MGLLAEYICYQWYSITTLTMLLFNNNINGTYGCFASKNLKDALALSNTTNL